MLHDAFMMDDSTHKSCALSTLSAPNTQAKRLSTAITHFVQRWFKVADADMDGRVTGSDAVA